MNLLRNNGFAILIVIVFAALSTMIIAQERPAEISIHALGCSVKIRVGR